MLLFVFVIILNASFLSADNAKIPPVIDPFQYSVPGGTKYSYSAPYNDIYGFPGMRIWGWSRSGKIAYSVERNIEGRGGTLIQFIIFDTVTDTTVYELNIDSNDYTINQTPGNLINMLYELEKTKIINAMDKNNIVQRQTDFLPLPIKSPKGEYNCFVNIEQEEFPEFYDRIKEYRVNVSFNGKNKIIKNTTDVEAVSVYTCGYFLSPFENRAVVIIGEERWGFEGTELFYLLSGCNLDRGFN